MHHENYFNTFYLLSFLPRPGRSSSLPVRRTSVSVKCAPHFHATLWRPISKHLEARIYSDHREWEPEGAIRGLAAVCVWCDCSRLYLCRSRCRIICLYIYAYRLIKYFTLSKICFSVAFGWKEVLMRCWWTCNNFSYSKEPQHTVFTLFVLTDTYDYGVWECLLSRNYELCHFW